MIYTQVPVDLNVHGNILDSHFTYLQDIMMNSKIVVAINIVAFVLLVYFVNKLHPFM